jgi:hypothetical protein
VTGCTRQGGVRASVGNQRALRRRRLLDRGASSVEVVAYTSLLMAGVTILIQVLATALGVLACQAAANHALQTARVSGGTSAAATAQAGAVLTQFGRRLVTSPTIRSSRSPATTTVLVSGTALRVVPGLSVPVHATVSGPTEPVALAT